MPISTAQRLAAVFIRQGLLCQVGQGRYAGGVRMAQWNSHCDWPARLAVPVWAAGERVVAVSISMRSDAPVSLMLLDPLKDCAHRLGRRNARNELSVLANDLGSRRLTGESIYPLEIERIFARGWNFMCHALQLKEPGEYLVSYTS